MKKTVRGSLIALALPMLLAAVVLFNFSLPPAAFYRLESLKTACDKDGVIKVLGTPTDVRDNGKTFVYSRYMSWGILYVYMDEAGKFSGYEYDK